MSAKPRPVWRPPVAVLLCSPVTKSSEGGEREKSQAAEAIDPAAARTRVAADERDKATSALEAIRRAHAAVHAAEGCQPGDDCPICQRPLPADFAMQSPPGDAEARAAQTAAERAAEESASALAAREAELNTASAEVERAGQAAQDPGKRLWRK
jgi:DNA repair protein SbcC/Rad50